MVTRVEDCVRTPLPRFEDWRGNLTVVEGTEHVPFAIRRAYWLYEVPGGEERTGHAYRRLEEFFIALSGSFDLVVDDGESQRTFQLNRSYYGVYVPSMIWRSLTNFSTNAVGLVLASEHYDEDDYLRSYDAFAAEKRR